MKYIQGWLQNHTMRVGVIDEPRLAMSCSLLKLSDRNMEVYSFTLQKVFKRPNLHNFILHMYIMIQNLPFFKKCPTPPSCASHFVPLRAPLSFPLIAFLGSAKGELMVHQKGWRIWLSCRIPACLPHSTFPPHCSSQEYMQIPSIFFFFF